MKYPEVAALFDGNSRPLVDIAADCGVRPPSVTRWHKGEARPSQDVWPALAEALDVAVDAVRDAYLATPTRGGGTSPRRASAPAPTGTTDSEVGSLQRQIEALARLVAGHRQRIEALELQGRRGSGRSSR